LYFPPHKNFSFAAYLIFHALNPHFPIYFIVNSFLFGLLAADIFISNSKTSIFLLHKKRQIRSCAKSVVFSLPKAAFLYYF